MQIQETATSLCLSGFSASQIYFHSIKQQTYARTQMTSTSFGSPTVLVNQEQSNQLWQPGKIPRKKTHFRSHTCEPEARGKGATALGLTDFKTPLSKLNRHWKGAELRAEKKKKKKKKKLQPTLCYKRSKENLSNLFRKYISHDFRFWLLLCWFLTLIKRNERYKD